MWIFNWWDLGLKPSTIEQTKFECSPLSKTFNKGLSEDGKKEGLFKRLKILKAKVKYSYKLLKTKEKNNWGRLKILTRVIR